MTSDGKCGCDRQGEMQASGFFILDKAVKGKGIIFSAPSGSGKTTIVHNLLARGLPLLFSISACTRQPRSDERDGRDYYFIPVNEFKKLVENDEFLEWEEVYKDHFYGTLRSELTRIWDQEKHVVFDVDVAGGLNLKRQFANQALALFIMPPSLPVLKQRLEKRSADPPEKIKVRLEKAKQEMEYAGRFDRIIVNDQLDVAVQEAYDAVSAFLELK